MKITARIHETLRDQPLKAFSVNPAEGVGHSIRPNGLLYSVRGYDDSGEPFYAWTDLRCDVFSICPDVDAWLLDVESSAMLTIRSQREFESFCAHYAAGPRVDWAVAAVDYAGVEITPTSPSHEFAVKDGLRRHVWGFAGGVIWDMRALTGWTRNENHRENPLRPDRRDTRSTLG